MSQRVTWTCEYCGKDTDGRSGMDDAFDCFCSRCQACHEVVQDCVCDDRDDWWEDDENYA